MSTKFYDIRFTGTMTSLTPINIVPPGTPEVMVGDLKAYDVVHRTIIHEGQRISVPVIPASTIRGKLRRSATRIALSHLKQKPNMKAWLHSTLGSIKGGKAEENFSVTKRSERRAALPVIGLFGAAEPWDASAAYITDATPQTPVEADGIQHARTNDFQAKLDIFDVLNPEGAAEFFAHRDAARASSAAKKAAPKNAKKQAAVSEGAEEAPAAPAEIVNSLQQMLAHRYMPAGVVMDQTMMLKRVTGIEAGLFLKVLQDVFENEPQFGGKASLMYGEVAGAWNIKIRESGAAWAEVGSIDGRPYEAMAYQDPLLNQLIAEWTQFAEREDFSIEI